MSETHTGFGRIASNRSLVVAYPAARDGQQNAAADASFLSQQLAERFHLPVQSVLQRAPVSSALGAYREGKQRAVRRLPAGYRTSRSI